MKLTKRASVLAAGLALAGCATKYQERGFTGGVSAFPMTSDSYRIEARGNGYTGQSRIVDFVMLKAAETTLAAGKTHFLFISSSDASSQGFITSPGSVTTNVYGSTAYSNYNPATTSSYIKSGQDTYIRFISAVPSQSLPPGAVSASDVEQNIGPRLKSSS